MKKLFFCGIISAFLFSCSSNDQPVSDNTIVPAGTDATVNTNTSASQTTTTTSTTTPATLPATGATVPAITTAPPGAVTQQNIAAKSQSSNAGINPAHGQPGHRCDISVGAPLNSPPGNANKTVTQMTAPAPAPMKTVQAPATPTAKGMNPPHGQPGHRCDIAVGAPLSSASSKPAVKPVTPATIQSEERANSKTIPVVPQ